MADSLYLLSCADSLASSMACAFLREVLQLVVLYGLFLFPVS